MAVCLGSMVEAFSSEVIASPQCFASIAFTPAV